MRIYGQTVSNKKVPQTQPLFGKNMILNNAGGYVFKVDPQVLLERFLTIGTEGGTYYVNEQKLTQENAVQIIDYIKLGGSKVLDTVVNFATNNRAPKADPGIFVLALVLTYANQEVKQNAYSEIVNICRTTTQLFMLLANLKELRGWSAGLRKGVAAFYLKKSSSEVEYQLAKYRQRNGWTHKDAIRLSHPKANKLALNALLKYAIGKAPVNETGSGFLVAVETMLASTDPKEVITLINNQKSITWEMVPTNMLNNKEVLSALAGQMPITALVRNLNRFAYTGLTDGNTNITQLIKGKLSNKNLIKKSRIHPITLLSAMRVYSRGHGDKGNKTWVPNQSIVDALNDAFYLAVEAIEPTNKRILVGVDVSGSMTSSAVAGMALTPKDVAAVMSFIILRTEPNAELYWFDTQITNAKVGKRHSLEEIMNLTPNGGGTDCSLPIRLANHLKKEYDAIMIYTDSETWAGNQHGQVALDEYKKKYNKDVKVVEVAAVSNNSTQFEDVNVLRVSGFDASVPRIVNDFIK